MNRSRHAAPLLVAVLALVLALSSTAYSAVRVAKVSGNSLVKKGSLSGNRLKADTVTGKQVAEGSLGPVPRAVAADRATVADRVPAGGLSPYAFGPSWQPDTATSRAGGFRKDGSGFVHLQGAVSRPSGVSTLIAVLPPGFRPGGPVPFVVWTAGGAGAVVITPAGEVALIAGSPTSVSLEGVVFYPDA